MTHKHIKYEEGQWFAVPLHKSGYSLGIIVRGSYKTKGGLGYFFGPKYEEIPDNKNTWEKKPEEAILIARFSDLGIINGNWPIISSTRPFSKDMWPIPNFGQKISLLPGKGFIREYDQDDTGQWKLIRETIVDEERIISLPEDGLLGGGVVEARLSYHLDQ